MNRMQDDEIEVVDEAFDHKILKKAVQILQSGRFVSDESQKVIDWYETETRKFKGVKAQIDQFKLDGAHISYEKNREL